MSAASPPSPRASAWRRRLFAAHVRRRGEECYRRGAVHITHADAVAVSARVQGTRRYSAEIKFAADGVRVLCDCPAFEWGACKHIWAAVLQAEERGLAVPLRPARGSESGFDPLHPDGDVVPDLEYDPEYDPDFFLDPELDAGFHGLTRASGSSHARPSTARPADCGS